MKYETTTNGKVLRAGGADDPRHRVLCLPGGLCTAVFYDDLLAMPALAAGGVRAFATTLPGFGGVPFPPGFDASVEAHAAYAGELARDLDCDAVVGHSFGANVAIEMAAGGHFDGPLILLPSRRCSRIRCPTTASTGSPPKWQAATGQISASTYGALTSTSTGTGRSPAGCAGRAFRPRSSSARTTRWE
jgi:hypothetical protein